jgi:hypothetical protein
VILLLALLSCVEAPEPCVDMCAEAAAVQCGCLESWGSDWSDIGMESQQDFYARCQTWAWEMALLEKDARSRGVLEDAGVLEDVCEERTEALQDPELSCEEWSAMDWSVTPWD